ncbi:MAG: protein translocase subunit SecD [Ilumatobacteraceae bacterium]
MNKRKLIISLVAIMVVSFGGLLLSVTLGNTPALGLDLQGGISVTQQPVGDFDPVALDLAVERIRDRVDSLGVAEPEILRQGDAIVVNLPGVKNQQEAIELVQVTGQVYLRPVIACQNEGQPTTTDTTVPGSTTEAPTTTAAPGPGRRISGTPTTTIGAATTGATTTPTTTGGATTTTVAGDSVPTSSTVVVSDPTQQQVLPLRGGGECLVGPAQGTGAVFENDATADFLDSGWGVRVGLRQTSDGVDTWNALALQCNLKQESCPSGRLAIELDGEIISAPTVNEPNFTTGVDITGEFTETEARNLAKVLKSGSLPVKMETVSVQNVSPTLGTDSLRAAIIAGIIGVALVLLLLIAYYGVLGFVVVVGVMVSGGLLYSIISLLSTTQGLTLSLSGIAGIIVSVGVTVDSYVVFFERLKDELRAGRSLKNSASRGFAGAWRTILIADIVSLIGAFTLWYLTVGSVRNFAFFLGLSTLADLVVAYFFTRPTVLLLARTDWMARRKVMGIDPVDPRPAPSASGGTAVAGSLS